ncbi:hypothetical protein BaRGS_00025775 [Batillaria attramentaria]|uniref:HTH psq-type domain-containing protein n=1 Tax=Batillaria attramentaria TaxID=370345 RepID=A0ABD0K7N2_9CAEN
MKTVTLEETVEVIKLSDRGLSSRALATQFGVGRTQIQNCVKRKAEVLSDSGVGLNALSQEVFGCDFCDVADIDADLTVCESRQAVVFSDRDRRACCHLHPAAAG